MPKSSHVILLALIPIAGHASNSRPVLIPWRYVLWPAHQSVQILMLRQSLFLRQSNCSVDPLLARQSQDVLEVQCILETYMLRRAWPLFCSLAVVGTSEAMQSCTTPFSEYVFWNRYGVRGLLTDILVFLHQSETSRQCRMLYKHGPGILNPIT